MEPLVTHQEDPSWKSSFEAVKTDPDNFDLWENLIDDTERVQRAACAVIDSLLKSPSAYSVFSNALPNNGSSHGPSLTIPSGPVHTNTNSPVPSASGAHNPKAYNQKKNKKDNDSKEDQPAADPLSDDQLDTGKSFPQTYLAIKSVTRKVYDMFLERFPLLFGYWTKYVEWEVLFSNQFKLLQGDDVIQARARKQFLTSAPIGVHPSCESDALEQWDWFLNVPKNALAVHERAVTFLSLSIDIWTGYFSFLETGLADRISTFTKTKPSAPEETHITENDINNQALFIRSVFERAAQSIGQDFLADPFWDAYLDFEEKYAAYLKPSLSKTSAEPEKISSDTDTPVLSSPTRRIAHILSKIVRIPLHQYARYYERFVADAQTLFLELDGNRKEPEMSDISLSDKDVSIVLRPSEIRYLKKRYNVADIKPEQGRESQSLLSAQMVLDYYANFVFVQTQAGTTDRWAYESLITRPYFHVLDLEQGQLDNWTNYLTWEQNEYQRIKSLYYSEQAAALGAQADGDTVMNEQNGSDAEWKFVDEGILRNAFAQVQTLYERALIPCALYDSIWIRYARWVYSEALSMPSAADDQDLLNERAKQHLIEETRNIYRRASCIFVPISRPFIRFQYAFFEESLGEVAHARDILTALQEATCAAVAASRGAPVGLPYAKEGIISVSAASGGATKKSKPRRGKSRKKTLALQGTKENDSNDKQEIKQEGNDVDKKEDIVDTDKEEEEEQKYVDIVDVKWRDILAAAAQTAAGAEATKAGLKYEQDKLSQKNQGTLVEQATSHALATPNTSALPTVLSKMLASIDTTEPFFYRIEFERRVHGPLAAFRYISQVLGDYNEPRQKEVVELYKSLGIDDTETDNEANGKSDELQPKEGQVLLKGFGSDLDPLLLKAGISRKMKDFLVSARAELVAEAYKLGVSGAGDDKDTSALSLIETFAKCVSIARSYYQTYIDLSITKDVSTSIKTAGPAIALPKFWVSYFGFETSVVRQLVRMENKHVVYFHQLAAGALTSLVETDEVSLASTKKRKRGGSSASAPILNIRKELFELPFDSATVADYWLEYVQQYLDKLVDYILQVAGIPQSVVIDLVRTYIDDVLTILLGKRASRENRLESEPEPDTAPVSQTLILDSLRQLLGASQTHSASSDTQTSQPNTTLSRWVANRAVGLEIELNGPMCARTQLLTKLSDDGNPETAKSVLRTAVGQF